MGKLASRHGEAAQYTPPTATLESCCECGWEWATQNKAKVYFDADKPHRYRREPRTQIAVRAGAGKVVQMCCDCYEKMLFERGLHTKQAKIEREVMQGEPLDEALYREGLFSIPSRKLTAEEIKDARGRMAQLQARVGAQHSANAAKTALAQRMNKQLDPSGHD